MRCIVRVLLIAVRLTLHLRCLIGLSLYLLRLIGLSIGLSLHLLRLIGLSVGLCS